MKKIKVDKNELLKDYTFYKSILTKIYKFNRDINRQIANHLQKTDLEDY